MTELLLKTKTYSEETEYPLPFDKIKKVFEQKKVLHILLESEVSSQFVKSKD